MFCFSDKYGFGLELPLDDHVADMTLPHTLYGDTVIAER